MAAPEFTLFVAPYVEGYQDGEEGNTPITAEILNENYDAFLLALNEWAASVGLAIDGIPTKTSDLNNDSNFVADASYVHTDNNYTTTEKNKLSGIEANANNYSLPTASASTLGGVKIDGITITIDANGVISSQGGGTDVEGNPSGTPTAVLSSIRIGSTVYSIPGGGGGGSSVSFTQILATGTKIGTITIDGVPTDIYAPAPPTKTSDLTNDSNFVADANYVHTDNNYTTTEKNKLSGLVAVEANPSGSASTDLTKIAIGGTNYNIPSGGGGGTTVVANPSGSPTGGDLNKLQVGNDIYSIPSGGSGSGGHTILNDGGTALSQENNLQFKGTYVHDDSTNSKTVVEVSRTMNLQQYNSLSDAEKKGVIVITDENPDPNYVEVAGTLLAGETSLALSDYAIKENSTFDGPYTTVFGVNPTNMVVTSGDHVLQEFVTQESELSGTVTVSSLFSNSYPAWQAFLDSTTDGWVAADSDTAPYLEYEFPSAVRVDEITWYTPGGTRESDLEKVQYSLDGTTWIDCTLSTNEPNHVEIEDAETAQYWKMIFADGPYSQYMAPMVSKLQFISVGVGTLTLTFPAQQTDVGVKVRVS